MGEFLCGIDREETGIMISNTEKTEKTKKVRIIFKDIL